MIDAAKKNILLKLERVVRQKGNLKGRRAMICPKNLFILFISVQFLSFAAGCDHLARARFAEGNSYTDKENHLDLVPFNREGDKLPGYPNGLLAADINGDGFDDVIAHYDNFQVVQIGLSPFNSKLGFIWLDPIPAPRDGFRLAVADLDGDRKDDVLLLDVETDEATTYGVKNSWNNVEQISKNKIDCHPNSPVAAVDTNKDGFADLICREGDKDQNRRVVTYLSEIQGGFGSAIVSGESCRYGCVTEAQNPSPNEAWKFGDLDGDGNIDLVEVKTAYLDDMGGPVIYYGDGTGRFSKRHDVFKTETISTDPGLGDFDGDGLMDLVWRDWDPELEQHKPVVLFGSKDRVLLNKQSAFCNLLSGVVGGIDAVYGGAKRLGVWGIGDLNGDSLDDFAQVGGDVDFGVPGPAFLRVLLGKKNGLEFTSNLHLTDLLSKKGQDIDAPVVAASSAVILAADYKGNGRNQLMVVDLGTLQYSFFEWKEVPVNGF